MKMITVNGKRQKLKEITISARVWYSDSNANPYHSVKVWLNDECLGIKTGMGSDYLYSATYLVEEFNKNLSDSIRMDCKQQTNIGTGKLEYVMGATIKRVPFENHGVKWSENYSEVKRKKDLH